MQKVIGQNDAYSSAWHGRLALRVQADPQVPQRPAQSFSADFDLQGSARQGQLIFFTPIGSTAALIHWTPENAVLQANGETRTFDNLNQLITQLLGADLPVAALFLWLNGQNQDVAGWQVDLSNRAQGKITARRQQPTPTAELKLLLQD